MDASFIRLLILDVDGVLTDGRLVYGPDGQTDKTFNARDGHLLKVWQSSGGKVAILSGRTSRALAARALELGITRILEGAADKLTAYESILAAEGCGDSAVAYLGDDLPDLAPMRRCAFPIAVANAAPDVKRMASYITRTTGGAGAVAEVVELILRMQGRWSQILLSGK